MGNGEQPQAKHVSINITLAPPELAALEDLTNHELVPLMVAVLGIRAMSAVVEQAGREKHGKALLALAEAAKRPALRIVRGDEARQVLDNEPKGQA